MWNSSPFGPSGQKPLERDGQEGSQVVAPSRAFVLLTGRFETGPCLDRTQEVVGSSPTSSIPSFLGPQPMAGSRVPDVDLRDRYLDLLGLTCVFSRFGARRFKPWIARS